MLHNKPNSVACTRRTVNNEHVLGSPVGLVPVTAAQWAICWARRGSAGWFCCRLQICGLCPFDSTHLLPSLDRGRAGALSSHSDARDARNYTQMHKQLQLLLISVFILLTKLDVASCELKGWKETIKLHGKENELREGRRTQIELQETVVKDAWVFMLLRVSSTLTLDSHLSPHQRKLCFHSAMGGFLLPWISFPPFLWLTGSPEPNFSSSLLSVSKYYLITYFHFLMRYLHLFLFYPVILHRLLLAATNLFWNEVEYI